MIRLPVVSGKEVVGRLERADFIFVRRTGSHMIMRRETDPEITVSIPDHKELKRGTLKSILRQINLSVDEFCNLE